MGGLQGLMRKKEQDNLAGDRQSGCPCLEGGLMLARCPQVPLYVLNSLTELLASLAPIPSSILPRPQAT